MKYDFHDDSSVKFHVSAKDSVDDLEVYEVCLKPGIIKIDPHFHENTEEFFHVLSGEVIFHADGREFLLKKGESFLVKRRMAHGFRAAGNEEARLLCSSNNEGRRKIFESAFTTYKRGLSNNGKFRKTYY